MNNIVPFVKKDVVLEEMTIKLDIAELYAIVAQGLEEYILSPDEVVTDLDLGLEIDEAGMVEFDVTVARVEDVAGRTR